MVETISDITRRVKGLSVDLLAAAWMAWYCVGIVWAYDVGASVYGVYGAYYGGFCQTAAVAVIWLWARRGGGPEWARRGGEGARRVAVLVLTVGAAAAVWTIIESVSVPAGDRAAGPMGGPIFTGQLLALAGALAGPGAYGWTYAMAMAAGILATGSRGGLVGLAAGVAVAWWGGRRERTAALALAAGIAWLGMLAMSRNRPAADLSDYGRSLVWRAAVEAIRDRPLTGWGGEGYFAVAVLYRTPEWMLPYPRQTQGHSHNWLLEAGIEAGVPGMILWGALMVACALALARAGRWRVLGALVAVGVGATFNPTALPVKAIMTPLVAGALPRTEWRSSWWRLIAAALAAIALYGWARCLYLDRSLRVLGGEDGAPRAWDAAREAKLVYEVGER